MKKTQAQRLGEYLYANKSITRAIGAEKLDIPYTNFNNVINQLRKKGLNIKTRYKSSCEGGAYRRRAVYFLDEELDEKTKCEILDGGTLKDQILGLLRKKPHSKFELSEELVTTEKTISTNITALKHNGYQIGKNWQNKYYLKSDTMKPQTPPLGTKTRAVLDFIKQNHSISLSEAKVCLGFESLDDAIKRLRTDYGYKIHSIKKDIINTQGKHVTVAAFALTDPCDGCDYKTEVETEKTKNKALIQELAESNKENHEKIIGNAKQLSEKKDVSSSEWHKLWCEWVECVTTEQLRIIKDLVSLAIRMEAIETKYKSVLVERMKGV